MEYQPYVLAATWVRAHRYCEVTGESMETLTDRIQDGVWAAGKHYKRTGPRTLWINLPEAAKWVEQQPHVESQCPKASKSATARAKAA